MGEYYYQDINSLLDKFPLIKITIINSDGGDIFISEENNERLYVENIDPTSDSEELDPRDDPDYEMFGRGYKK